MLLVFAEVAVAEPRDAVAPPVGVAVWEARLAMLAGADIVQLPVFAAELSHGVGGAGTVGAAGWSARWMGAERSVEGRDLVSIQLVDVGISTSLPFSPGLFLSTQLGTPSGWTTSALNARFAQVKGRFSGEARFGGAFHTEPVGYALAPNVSAGGEFRATPRLSLGLSTDAQLWFVEAAPPVTANAATYLRWNPSPPTSVTVATGVIAAAVNDAADPDWVGLAPAGTTDGWLRVRPAWSPVDAVWLVGDVGGRLRFGSEIFSEMWAMAGVEVQVSGLGIGPTTMDSVRCQFATEAPLATRVQVAGSFGDWTAVEMHRDKNGIWRVEVELLPGAYEYVYLIDGVATAPPEAATRLDDGLGGTNGLLVVSGSNAR